MEIKQEFLQKIPKLVGPLTEIYLDRILNYFSTSTLSDTIKINTLLNNLSDEVFDDIKAICSDTDILDLKIVIKKLTYLLPALDLNTLINKFNFLQQNSSESFMLWNIRVWKLHKKCKFLDDSRLKEKLRTSTLNDKIIYKFSKNFDLTLNQMVELGVKLDSSNIKSEDNDISYINNDKKYNYGNNNSRYHDNYNNYNYNNYRYNNNHQSNYGRNNTWYDNNQRKQIQYGDGNRNNYQSYYNNSNNYRGNDNYQRKQIQYNNNSNNYRGNDNNQRKQIQYNNNSNNYRGGDENNRKQIQYNNDYNMNIEEIIEEKVDSTKNKDDNFNVNNLSGDVINDKDNAFMTTLKVNDIVTCMQIDTGSKHTIIPHGLAKKLGIRDLKKSELQLTAYDGNLIKIIGNTQVKVTYEGISKYLQAVIVESSKNALLGRTWINAFKNILNKFIANINTNYEDEIKKLIKECESKLTNGPINKASVKLHLRSDAQPKIIPPRRIPYSKIDLVSNELKKMDTR
ncbi:putative uncharacterized protein DDB_G0282499 [Gordionus sp. m RMFG-2023]|uniref:putative uncharacterized protein DDB_G0282499 n=1 Tax=Gordionus sp. m RMFG-2023 TaxID=3053472 RepID=UPI0031FC0FBC